MSTGSDRVEARRARLWVQRCCEVGLGTVTLYFFVLASIAFAGPPTHLPKPALNLNGTASDPGSTHPPQPFNRACGVAVDSQGNTYVASAANDAIDVFDATHEYLTSITNTSEPCGLAVNSTGRLYVSESATGEVVRYTPSAYPFSGPPTYAAPTVVDASGDAQGIAVDRVDDRLYVAAGDHITVYNGDGSSAAANEVQHVISEGSAGTFKLSFEGQETEAIAWNAAHVAVQSALEGISTIGIGNVSVTEGFDGQDHVITFEGALANTNVELLKANTSALTGNLRIPAQEGHIDGFNGQIGDSGDALVQVTGVAAYTYESGDRYVFAADLAGGAPDEISIFGGTDVKALELRTTIEGPQPDQNFNFGSVGAYLAADPGNRSVTGKCASIAEQACTGGHFFVYDANQGGVVEFDASGEFVTQLTSSSFADSEPTAIAVDRSGGPNDGAIYVTSGPGPGAELLAFDPLVPPSRAPVPALSRALANTRAVATDSYGNVYATTGSEVHVYGSDGVELSRFEDPNTPLEDLAVDSTGKVYVLEDQEVVTYYTPSAFPPTTGTTYVRQTSPVASATDFPAGNNVLKAIAIDPLDNPADPKDGQVFVTSFFVTHTYNSAAKGSTFQGCFACSLGLGVRQSIAVHGASGKVYFGANPGLISVVNATGTEFVARIKGGGSPNGLLPGNPYIAVDQTNGHLLAFHPNDPAHAIREYDASGGFVAEFGEFGDSGEGNRLAIDNACALHEPPLTAATTPTCEEFDPSDGTAYLAFDDQDVTNPFDVSAFGPLSYGEAPLAVTGTASALGSGSATLNGTVNPNSFTLTECEFEYLTDALYLSNGKTFTGALQVPCVPGPSEIGLGSDAVAVHASIAGLDPEGRYRYRLVARNKYGEGTGDAGLFGPPVLTIKEALPVLYDEATLRANLDPSGLRTTYHFEYGTIEGVYDQSTPTEELAPSAKPSDVEATLVDLAEGTEYRFRVVVENEAKVVSGPDQAFETAKRATAQDCPNAEYRTGLSANLPNCRAYELVTPAETNGLLPYATGTGSAGAGFNNWLTPPRGVQAGENLSYFTDGTLPGFNGTGLLDGYRAHRSGSAHPIQGWTSEIFSPSYLESAPTLSQHPLQRGVASDQLYSFWRIQPEEPFAETLPKGIYLRTPDGAANNVCSPNPTGYFELVGCGSLGVDPEALDRYVSPGGGHVIFASDEHLEAEAAPQETVAIYDRGVGEQSARVISMTPDGSPFAAGEHATYVAATEDGAVIAFKVGGTLYLHSEGKSIAISAAPNTFAGISEDGKRVFYAATVSGGAPATIFVCNTEIGPCTGTGAHAPIQIASNSIFVNVSTDGSNVFFASEEVVPGTENDAGETPKAGEQNLYVWDADTEAIHFVAALSPQDFISFGGIASMDLGAWTGAIVNGRASSPTRSTPDGEVFVFQSHARLSSYDNEGHGEIYRYAPAAEPGERLLCVSCDPSGGPASGDAMLQDTESSTGGNTETVIPNVVDDGTEVFFQSLDPLLPEDANRVDDIYEWQAKDGESCERTGGCLALISSGQGETPSKLYSMSANGHDVFFGTLEKLVGADVAGSPSIYDARREGGIPEPSTIEDCQGDACQGNGSAPPILPPPVSTGSGDGNLVPIPSRCRKGKHRVKGRCVKNGHKKRHRQRKHQRGRSAQ